jgi:hypothetical protein
MLSVASTWMLLAGPARAQTVAAASGARWPVTAEDEEARLGYFLEAERSDERSQYWSMGIGALAVGLPQVAFGGYMLEQTNAAAKAIGPGMIVGGTVDCLLGIVPLFAPTPMSMLRDLYESERRSGKPPGEVVHDVEEKWRSLVTLQRRQKRLGGIVSLALGVPAFTTGLVFAIAGPGLARMSPQTQYGWGGALLGFDFLVYQGVASLVAPPPVDTAFDTYQLLKHGTPASAPRVGFVPARGGGALTLAATF